MFDCPPQIQTSPISTSLIVTVFLPVTTSSWPTVFIFMAGNLSIHLPSASALVVAWALPTLTVTCSPGSAVPQTGTGRSRCSTA